MYCSCNAIACLIRVTVMGCAVFFLDMKVYWLQVRTKIEAPCLVYWAKNFKLKSVCIHHSSYSMIFGPKKNNRNNLTKHSTFCCFVLEGFDKTNGEHKSLLLCLFMTCADLSDQTKPWSAAKRVSVSTCNMVCICVCGPCVWSACLVCVCGLCMSMCDTVCMCVWSVCVVCVCGLCVIDLCLF